MDQDDLIYIAGFFDGEGCVYFNRNRIVVGVSNTNRSILDWLRMNFGGCICTLPSGRPNCKPAWVWHLGGMAGVDFLSSIQPWLRIKQDQACVAFAWGEIKIGRGRRHTEEYAEALQLLKSELKWLNHKGSSERGSSPIEEVVRCLS